jgi:hypothetical protein
MLIRAFVPRFIYYLGIKRLADCDLAYKELEMYLKNMISAAREEPSKQQPSILGESGKAMRESDLLRLLVQANEEQANTDQHHLSHDELLSDVYVMRLPCHQLLI